MPWIGLSVSDAQPEYDCIRGSRIWHLCSHDTNLDVRERPHGNCKIMRNGNAMKMS